MSELAIIYETDKALVVRLHDEQMKILMMSVKEWKEYQAERDKPLEIRVEKAAAA